MKITPRQLLCALCALAPAAFGQVVQLEQINVSAQKRIQSISDVPVPITAYTGSFLERAGITDFKSLAPLVPGLFIQEQSPNNPGINLRGITTDRSDPRAEARISMFQDGVSISRSRASVLELFDLERIEVLKGPQGTLFGRGAEIGALSLVQNKPKNETSGQLTVGLGDYNERRASGYVNTPVGSKELLGRVAFAWRQHDGVVDNLADGSDLNGKNTKAVRGALRWQPSPDTTVDFIGNWQHDKAPGTAFKSGVIPTSRGDTNHFTAAELNRGSALGTDRTVVGVTAIAEHKLSSQWTLTSITGWRQYDSYEDFDADGGRIFLLEFAEDARGRQFSQELRFNYNDGGRFTGFAGIGYFHENGAVRVPLYTDERQLWPFLTPLFRDNLLGLAAQAGLGAIGAQLINAALPAANPFAPQATLPVAFAAFNNPLIPASLRALSGLAGAPLRPYRTDEYTQDGRTRAVDVFIDGTWRATEALEFTAGLRLTRENLNAGYEAHNGSPPTLGFIVNSIPGYPYLPTAGRRSASESTNSWDGRVNGRYVFNKSLNAYASVSRGHRPRSLLVDSTSTTSVREETVINYEAGLKGALAAGRLQWAASVYRYDYSHFQTSIVSLGAFTTIDSGNATGEGFEFGLQGRVTDNLSAFANYAFTDATFDDKDDTGRRQQYAGYAFRLTPRQSLSIGGTATFPIAAAGEIFVTPIYTYKSKHYFEDDNAQFGYSLRQDGYGTATLRAGWRSPKRRWEITAHAENIFDKEYLIDAGNVGGSFGIPTFIAGDPRRVRIEASVRW
jgi:iron complex outermembrane recepter protein